MKQGKWDGGDEKAMRMRKKGRNKNKQEIR